MSEVNYISVLIGIDDNSLREIKSNILKPVPDFLLLGINCFLSDKDKIEREFFNILGNIVNLCEKYNIKGISFLYDNSLEPLPFKTHVQVFSLISTRLNFRFDNEIVDTEKKYNAWINNLTKEICDEILELRKTHNFILSDLTSSSNKTPLLLPFKSYNYTKMEALATEIFKNIHCSEQKEVSLKTIKNKFNFNNKKIKLRVESKEIEFYSDNGMVFKSPGRDMHGVKRLNDQGNHNALCYLNGVYRFGSKIRDGFHYDCTDIQGNTLNKRLEDCCEEKKQYSNTYINIYPNDYTRKK